MERSSDVRTRRWTRSPRGEILGVATGLAEWRGFPPSTTRLLVFLSVMFTGFFPGSIIYLIAAIILPMQTPADVISRNEWFKAESRRSSRRGHEYEDATYTEAGKEEKSTEDLRAEYENLKKKVEEMEGQIFDREKDWDARFNNEDKS